MDELIKDVEKQINIINFKIKQVEKDPYATKTTIKAKTKPFTEEKNRLMADLSKYMQIKDSKIPDHEKLPKDCTFAIHYLQVEKNDRIKDRAVRQIKEDRELL